MPPKGPPNHHCELRGWGLLAPPSWSGRGIWQSPMAREGLTSLTFYLLEVAAIQVPAPRPRDGSHVPPKVPLGSRGFSFRRGTTVCMVDDLYDQVGWVHAEFWFRSIISNLVLPPVVVRSCQNSWSAPKLERYLDDQNELELPFQDVDHDEPPAIRDSSALRLQSEEDWAAAIEFCLHGIARVEQESDVEDSRCQLGCVGKA